ncbi:hypothetical protein PS627_04138 [Pseudomonas fluorescens]|nr:hypothetical protein PS627_04138 [Pseudomonas fluorescens]VVQ05399.1 hypothetical protein PS910_04247 [Pseudomonas fluorescens]
MQSLQDPHPGPAHYPFSIPYKLLLYADKAQAAWIG